jgi:hypothetical protein
MITLTEVFPCFFLSCKANARVKPAKTGHDSHSSQFLCCSMYFFCSMYFCVVLYIVCFVTYSVLFVCICVLYYCHRVATQLQLNISYINEVGSEYFLTCLYTGLIIFVRRQVLQKHNKNGFNVNLSLLNDMILQRFLQNIRNFLDILLSSRKD